MPKKIYPISLTDEEKARWKDAAKAAGHKHLVDLIRSAVEVAIRGGSQQPAGNAITDLARELRMANVQAARIAGRLRIADTVGSSEMSIERFIKQQHDLLDRIDSLLRPRRGPKR